MIFVICISVELRKLEAMEKINLKNFLIQLFRRNRKRKIDQNKILINSLFL